MTFVKSADTKVTVAKSQQDIIAILQRYGARDFGFDVDPASQIAIVRFRVTTGGRNLPVELKVEVKSVYKAMYGGKATYSRGRNMSQQWQDQSQRTAWRLLVDWLDAALSTTTMGIQTVEEVFLAHIVLPGADGKPRRMVEHMAIAAGSGDEMRLRLPSGVS